MKVLFELSITALALNAFGTVQAQTYPTKPPKLVISYPAGGSTDIVGRTVGAKLADIIGKSIVIDNRGGASGTIGAALVAKAPPDGYTLLLAAGAHALGMSIFLSLPYDLAKDFAPVSLVARSGYLLVLHPTVPAKTVKELVAIAKASPGKLNYASTGHGSTPHLAAELFISLTDAKMTNISYKGDTPAINDLLGGHVDLAFIGISGVAPHVVAGKLRALAVTTAQRISAMPELPTLAEAGVKGYEFGTWWGLVAPAGTPREIINLLARAAQKAATYPGLKDRFRSLGIDAASSVPDEFGAFIRAEIEKYARIAKGAGVQPQKL